MCNIYLDDPLDVEEEEVVLADGEEGEGDAEDYLNSVQEEAVHHPARDNTDNTDNTGEISSSISYFRQPEEISIISALLPPINNTNIKTRPDME